MLERLWKREHEIFVNPRELATMISIIGSCLKSNAKYYTTQCAWADDNCKFSIVFWASRKEMDAIRIQCLKMELINRAFHKYVVAIEDEEGYA